MSLARAASAFIERRPNATTVAAAMARGAAGDACAQRAEDAPWDARRCATFMAWSTGVAFALDRYVYSHLFALWWPPVWKSNLRHVRPESPSTRRLLDSVAVSVPPRSTEPAPDTLVDFHTGGRGTASATC